MESKSILEEIQKYKNISRNEFLYDKIKQRLNKSTIQYYKELDLILNSYSYTLKDLKKL